MVRLISLSLPAKCFDGCGNTLGLQTLDIGDGEGAGQQRIFGIAFEIAPIGHGAMNVDSWREAYMCAF